MKGYRIPLMRNAFLDEKRELPGVKHVDDCGFYCGNYPDLTEEDLSLIARCLES